MLPLRSATQKLIFVGAPLLVPDTCSLLDIIRDPTREKFGRSQIEAALTLLSKAEQCSPELSVVITQQVVRELGDHIAKEGRTATAAIQNLDRTIDQVIGVYAALGLLAPSVRSSLARHDFERHSRAVLDRFINVAIAVQEENEWHLRAGNRVFAGKAPAATGRQSFKDCLVLESLLAISEDLRFQGFKEPILFLTANVADFCKDKSGGLHPDLQPEFSRLGIDFAVKFVEARWTLFPRQ